MASASTLVRKAHEAWDLLEHETAAKLFHEAAKVETEEAAGRSKYALADQTMAYEVRAGICYFKAGMRDHALPFLEKAISFDWKAARLWSDRHLSLIHI